MLGANLYVGGREDKQYLFGAALLPEGATIDRTDAMVQEMSDIAMATPGVTSILVAVDENTTDGELAAQLWAIIDASDEPVALITE